MNDKKTKTKTYEDYVDFLDNSSIGIQIVKDNELLIKRELHYFNSEENKNKEGLQSKVGSNDESYKAILRNLKFNCLEAPEDYKEEIEKFFVDRLVKELLLNNLWKKAKISFEDKILVNLDFIEFIKKQVSLGRLVRDEEHYEKTKKIRFIAVDKSTSFRYFPSSINWNSLDTVVKEETEETEEK